MKNRVMNSLEQLEARTCLTATFPLGLTHSVAEFESTERWMSIDVGDFDNDEDMDIVSARFDNGSYLTATRHGSVEWSIERLPGNFAGAHDIEVGNITGVEYPDLVAISNSSGELIWYQGTAFGYGNSTTISNEVFEGRRVLIQDMDNDSDGDIIVVHSDRLVWFEFRQELQDFQRHFVIDTESNSNRIYDAMVGDLNSDNHQDIVIARIQNWGNSAHVLYGQDDGTFSNPAVLYEPNFGIRSVAIADFDNDSDDDVVLGLEGGSLLLYEQTEGNLQFSYQITNEANTPTEIRTADMDDDGDQDLVVSAFESDTVLFVENTHSTGIPFRQPQIVRNVDSPYGLDVADIDSDGDLDIVVAARNESSRKYRIEWYEQRLIGDSNNDGVFNSSDFVTVFRAGEYEDDIEDNSTFETGDWDGDGDFNSRDFVVAFQAKSYSANAVPISIFYSDRDDNRSGKLARIVDQAFERDFALQGTETEFLR